MKYYLSLLTFLLIAFQTIAQDKGAELQLEYLDAKTDSSKFQTFQNLYMYHITRDYDKAWLLLTEMDSLCDAINIQKCSALESLFSGYYYRMTGTYHKALKYFDEGYEKYKKQNDEGKMAVCLFNQGVVNSYLGDFEGAARKYIEARSSYEKVGNSNGLVNVSNSLGIVYKEIKEYEKAKASFLDGLSEAQKTDNIPMLAMLNNNVANLYDRQQAEPDSIIVYASKALALEKELGRNTGIASAYNILSVCYEKKGDLLKSLEAGKEALSYSTKSGSLRFMCIHALGLAEIYNKLNDLDNSERYFIEGINYADSIELIQNQAIGYGQYADLLFKKGDYKKAYENRLIHENFKDSIDIEKSRSEIADLETKYNTVLKDQELQAKELALNKRTYQRNLLLGGLGLISLLGGSVIWGLFSTSKRDKKIAIQAQDLQSQKIETLEKEKKLLSMSSLLEGQENERIRIAKDLHDGLGGLLTTVKAHFGKIQMEIDKIENLDIYQTANQMIDKAHDEVRRISHNLMPADLRAGGLPVAIRQLVHELKTIHEMKTEFELVGFAHERISEKVEISVYRITQELITNIIKYAKAENVFIQISKFENEIQIVVEDDGLGFDYESALRSNGLGLKSISSRVEQFKGSIDVVSMKDKGTSVTANIPY